MATIENQPEQASSLKMTLIVCAVISLVAAAAGYFASAMFLEPPTVAAAPAKKESEAKGGGHGGKEDHGSEAVGKTLVTIPPVMTNLAEPGDAWIRMELALVFEGEADEELAQEIHQDIFAYVRTLKLYSLEGGSGYQHLVADLEERASIRSEGLVDQILIRTLILE